MPMASAPQALPWAISARIRLVPSCAAVTFTAPRTSRMVMTSGLNFLSTALASAASRIVRAMSRVSSAMRAFLMGERGGCVGIKAHRECPGDMEGGALRAILDLVAAGGAVGDQECFGSRAANGGQQRQLGHLDRGIVGVGAVTECTGHAAAAGFDGLDLQIRNQPQRLLDRLERAEGFLVAVTMHDRFRAD